jgi:hypothetical protein
MLLFPLTLNPSPPMGAREDASYMHHGFVPQVQSNVALVNKIWLHPSPKILKMISSDRQPV